jgi:phenylalanyl-tRNA synthetase beta chain
MKVVSSWVKEWLGRTMLSDRQLVDAMERAGIEVEQVISSPVFDKGIVVGVVKKVVQHPDADRLKLVQVETGKESLSIVCGANNVVPDMKVAVARIGSVLPGGERIQKAKLRGQISEGMLCSERELKLGTDHQGIAELSTEVAVGTPLCDVFPADSVIDVKTPANRFDLLSVAGIARDAAGMIGLPVNEPPTPPLAAANSSKAPKLGTLEGSSRYMLGRFSVDPSLSLPPSGSIKARLEASGVRSIGPVVDVTNYVMLEYGQPLHAFDAAKVKLPVTVRLAASGETLTTLDGVARSLTRDDLVIADQSGPIALAGIMGGASTEVDSSTREILLEAAVFDAVRVRKSAKRLGLRTEASARFERGLPVELPAVALARASELLADHAKGKLEGLADTTTLPSQPRSIDLPVESLRRLSGLDINYSEAISVLHKLAIDAEKSVGETDEMIHVPTVPWWRSDLKLPEDLVEEIVRVWGYDNLPSTLPAWRPSKVDFDRVRARRRLVRDIMYAAGLFEVMSYSFISEQQLEDLSLDPAKHLRLKNPLSKEQAYLRSTLLPSHLWVLARNRNYPLPHGIFEISGVFRSTHPKEHEEILQLGVMLNRDVNAYKHAKGVLDALGVGLGVELVVTPGEDKAFAAGRAGSIKSGGRTIGRIGEIDPDLQRKLKLGGEVASFELNLGAVLEAPDSRRYQGLLRFPTIQRDITVHLDAGVTWADVSSLLSEYQVEFRRDYYGNELPSGQKALTLRLTLANPDRTATEDEAVKLEMAVVSLLGRKFGATRH